MWVYEKRLQYPVNITQTNAKLAQVIISQFGGPDGELAASQRYLSQRYTMPDGITKGLLNDIGTEELAHIEIVCAIIYQLTKNLSVEEIKASGFDKYYVDHTLGIWPQAAGGIPFNACVFQVKGDPITDLTEDLAAEQKAGAGNAAAGTEHHTGAIELRRFAQEENGVARADPVVAKVFRVAVGRDNLVAVVKNVIHLGDKILIQNIVRVKDEITVVGIFAEILKNVF